MDNHDLGIELSNLSLMYPVFRGNYPGIKTSIQRQILPLSPASFVAFSIHNLSHIDLPWCIEGQKDEIIRSGDKIAENLLDLRKIEKIMSFYSKIFIENSVVIDITSKKQLLEKYIESENGLISRDISGDQFYELMNNLEIVEKDLIHPISHFRDKILIFKTNYNIYFSKSNDYNSSYFELRYPYLTHPYINEDLLLKLINDYQIKGLASDTYGLENPLYFINQHEIPAYAKYYYKKKRNKLKRYRPVLSNLMANQKIYAKNLKNLEKIDTEARKYAYGLLTIIPFPLGNRDGNAVRVFFKEDKA